MTSQKQWFRVEAEFKYERGYGYRYVDVYARDASEACRIAIKQIRSAEADLPFVEKYKVV
jgi:hypothetical protein